MLISRHKKHHNKLALFFSSYPEVELETVTVNVTIQDFVADVESELLFRNMQQVPKETMFIFPVDSDTVVHTFYATMGDTRIEAMLWEKEEAQQLCKATSGMENLRYLQDQWDLWGPVFACFLGTLPLNREVTITLCYVQELPLQPDGAAQFCWPCELFPSRKYIGWFSSEEERPENVHFSICLKSAHGVSHIAVNSSYTPLQYTAPDQTSAEVSLKLPPWMWDGLNLLVYYRGSHTLSAVVERRDPKAPPGSLLGDPVAMVTLMPNIPEVVPHPGQLGELLFLMDRSLFQDAQNTLLFLLKSLPLGCYFNIYSFGATFKAFYPQSVEYTQESMDHAVGRISSICPDLGGCDLLGLLKSIYSTRLLHGRPRQLFIFIQRKISSEEEAVMAEVYRYRDQHRCFCFPTNRCDSFNLSQAMALETKGECVCIHSRMDMTSEAVKCLQRALQPLASGISLHWDLPPGLEVSMIRKAPEMIFQGHQRSIYAQIHGQAQDPEGGEGAVTLQYHVGSQSFDYTLRFSLSPSSDGRLPVHRMAMMHLLWKLAWEGTSRAEKDIRHSAVKSSVSLGVPSPFTSSVAVRMKQRDAWHRDSLPPDSSTLFSPSCNLVPCQLLWLRGFRPVWFKSTKFWMVQKCQFCLERLGRKAPDTEALTQLPASCKVDITDKSRIPSSLNPPMRRICSITFPGTELADLRLPGSSFLLFLKTGMAPFFQSSETSLYCHDLPKMVESGLAMTSTSSTTEAKDQTEEVSRIPLPSHNERVEPGTICKVAGWGWTLMTWDKTSVLMEMDLKVQHDKVCEESFKRNYLCQSMICTGDEDGKKSTSVVVKAVSEPQTDSRFELLHGSA
ncbi:von Willebrand factor A domain-containing protein 5A-like [Calonectris borealis]|uniref:von Willebrand factor A domain-containing protein 5A-like n=1 Tax=Calonectris borealis TaxID=1323832 RepID=UPI003F4C05C1